MTCARARRADQYDMAYGNKFTRIISEADHILLHERQCVGAGTSRFCVICDSDCLRRGPVLTDWHVWEAAVCACFEI